MINQKKKKHKISDLHKFKVQKRMIKLTMNRINTRVKLYY
jgi:hypothetical protein